MVEIFTHDIEIYLYEFRHSNITQHNTNSNNMSTVSIEKTFNFNKYSRECTTCAIRKLLLTANKQLNGDRILCSVLNRGLGERCPPPHLPNKLCTNVGMLYKILLLKKLIMTINRINKIIQLKNFIIYYKNVLYVNKTDPAASDG